MSKSDWAYLTESLDSNLVRRGVTAGLIPPPGADEFIFAFHSTDVVTDTYLHVKLEAIYNQIGDVVLNVAMNDLEEHPLDQGPVWQKIRYATFHR